MAEQVDLHVDGMRVGHHAGIESAARAESSFVKVQATRLDGRAGAELKRHVAGLLTGGEQLRVDLSATFIDSSGLGAIVSLIKLIGSRGDLAITGVGPRMHEMLHLTHLDHVLRVVA